MINVAPSILSADFCFIAQEIKRVSEADLLHLDVMDGRFVPNITFGAKMTSDIKKITTMPLDVHLMILQPENYIPQFIKAGADYITFHLEACKKPQKALQLIRDGGVKCGVAISPNTPVKKLAPLISQCDMVLLMSVHPGFSGQKFIQKSLERLKELRALRDRLSPKALIEIDGGINFDNIKDVADAGAQIVVAGNTVFKADSPNQAILRLKSLA